MIAARGFSERALATLVFSSLLVLSGHPAVAADESETDLAKKTQNPVADLISVAFQSNFNFNTGTKDATVYVLNVQPVIPVKLTEDWNLITRTTMPIIRIGRLPVNTQLQGFYNVDRPKDSSDWQLRLQIQFLLPK